MRRVLASALVAAFSIPLIAPALAADPDSQLPACCRRLGKHHCAMQDDYSQTSGPAVRAVAVRCSSFPAMSATPSPANTMWLGGVSSSVEPQFRPAFRRIRALWLYHGSLSPSHQKRGPPSQSL